jgi:guanylate kinase
MSAENHGLLIVVSAPSGGGKTTVCEQILAVNPNSARVITCTTRAARDGEQDGVDYYFLDAGTFEQRIQAGDFLEQATVYGNRYGTLKSEVLSKLRQNKDVLLSIDVQGAAALRSIAAKDPELRGALVTVFIAPPSLRVLEERLVRRGKDAPDVIKRRLHAARQEIAEWARFDYLIISTSVEEDVRQMQAILTAEKLRQYRVRMPVYD